MKLTFKIAESQLTNLSRKLSRIPDTVIQELSLSKLTLTTSLDFDTVLEYLEDVNIIDIVE